MDTLNVLKYNEKMIVIEKAEYDDIESISNLVSRIYLKYSAESDTDKGISAVLEYSSKQSMEERYFKHGSLLLIAKYNNDIAGMIEIKNNNHITLCFVDDRFFRRGIATKLFSHVKEIFGEREYTVNSTPSALAFYQSLGFNQLSSRIEEKDGVSYIPMIY